MYSIYKIKNTVNNKLYIGLTINSINKRFYSHKRTAAEGRGYYLHNAIRKYGENNFTIELLHDNIDSKIEARSIEKYYISFFNTFKGRGYNLTPGGELTNNIDRVVVTDGNKNFTVSKEEYKNHKFKHINEGLTTIFKGGKKLRVTSKDYEKFYSKNGWKTKNFNKINIKTKDGEFKKIDSKDYIPGIHETANTRRQQYMNKSTKEFKFFNTDEEIDLITYCNKFGYQYKILNEIGEVIQITNNLSLIEVENGLSQFRYMWMRDKDFRVLILTKEVIDKLKIKKRNYNLLGYKLIKIDYK